MGKIYTSIRGKEIDMEKMTLKNETVPAVGNAKVNVVKLFEHVNRYYKTTIKIILEQWKKK